MKNWLNRLLAVVLILFMAGSGLLLTNNQPAGDDPSGSTGVSLPVADASIPDGSGQTPADPLPSENPPAEKPPAVTTPVQDPGPEVPPVQEPDAETLPEDGSYTSKEDVALYLHLYGHLPGNFITKKEAEALGWTGGSLESYAPGMCIGGSRFGNYEGLLPAKKGRTYTECDIDTLGASSRGAKRIVFSNDGLIYYTEDHYESFELLYGEEQL